jgi:hypothetical protein
MTTKSFSLYLPLVALMAATRMHHFGDTILLPDASLAVFFLAGLFFNSRTFFVALLIEAGLLDYVAISQFSVSDFCVSPAYVFLIPTYFAMWFGGRLSTNLKVTSAIATLFIATTSAYLISNSSFYLLSDNILKHDFSNYLMQLTQYYSFYVGYSIMYVVLSFAAVKLFRWLSYSVVHKTA